MARPEGGVAKPKQDVDRKGLEPSRLRGYQKRGDEAVAAATKRSRSGLDQKDISLPMIGPGPDRA